MTIQQERNYIMKHPKYRCMEMPDAQVHAIYKQFQKLDYKKIERDMKAQEKENAKYHQMNIFDYMKGDLL